MIEIEKEIYKFPHAVAYIYELEQALRWYANPDNYKWNFPGQTYKPNGYPVSQVDFDEGQRARDILKERL